MKERPDAVVYASFSKRLIAASIDLFILFVVASILSYPVYKIVYGSYTPEMLIQDIQMSAGEDQRIDLKVLLDLIFEHNLVTKFVFMQFIMFSMMSAYVLYFWTKYSSTPGKWVVGCKVVDYNYDNLTLTRGICRIFGYIISCLTLFVGFIMGEYTQKKQCLHDKIASTYVINFKHDFSRFSSWMQVLDRKLRS